MKLQTKKEKMIVLTISEGWVVANYLNGKNDYVWSTKHWFSQKIWSI